jgi:hypothetical protein
LWPEADEDDVAAAVLDIERGGAPCQERLAEQEA